MNKIRKQQSLIKQKTTIIFNEEKSVRVKPAKKTYVKAINPLNLQIKPMSLKNLEMQYSEDFPSFQQEQFEDNKSCCCSDCGIESKKAKNMRKRFLPFQTKMSVLRKLRLRKRFKNAVLCIVYLLQKIQKIRQQERARRMFRYKTKVFDPTPLPPAQFNHINLQFQEKQHSNQQVQSIQARLIDQRHKQRQSVKLYLQQKLSTLQQSQNILSKITYSKLHGDSFSNILLSPTKIQKTQGDEQPTPRQRAKFIQEIIPNSPYLSHLLQKKQPESLYSNHTVRAIAKSLKQDSVATSQQINKFKTRKITLNTMKKLD